jgi:hypothetical protein
MNAFLKTSYGKLAATATVLFIVELLLLTNFLVTKQLTPDFLRGPFSVAAVFVLNIGGVMFGAFSVRKSETVPRLHSIVSVLVTMLHVIAMVLFLSLFYLA